MEECVRVLHVEDDPTDALLMQEILHEKVGRRRYSVHHVESLKGALRELNSHGFDAILLDMNLKDISGIDNIVAIKEQCPDTPVVILSGIDNDEFAMEAIDQGAQEYIVKGHCNGKVIRLAIQSSIHRKSVERKLYRQANFDELTGLPNRRMFRDYAEKQLTRAQRWKRSETFMYIDIDNFKSINDVYGHDAGDYVLKEAAIRMSSVLRASDMLCRYSGDEFVLMLDDRSEDIQSAARQAATKLLYTFNTPVAWTDHLIAVSASIGISFYPTAGHSFDSLLKQADDALYIAKKDGGGHFKIAALH